LLFCNYKIKKNSKSPLQTTFIFLSGTDPTAKFFTATLPANGFFGRMADIQPTEYS